MSRRFKNILPLKDKAYGYERRMNLTKEVLKDSTPIPQPLEYDDIDKEFKRWVGVDLDISFEGEKLPTFVLFSNQRFSEYMQTWQHVDEKQNVILNFKSVTRENNPKAGTIVGNTRNIPGERTYLMKRVEARDKNDRKYFIDYRVKQPFSVDLIYTVSLFTNKYELLNEFNLMMNNKFKAIDCYIRPNGHFIPMKLTDISDESEYSIDNRQYYSQSYHITVMAYIMPRDSFKVVERSNYRLIMGDLNKKKNTYAEIEDMPISCKNDIPYEYEKEKITVYFDKDASGYEFTMDSDIVVTDFTFENIRSYMLYINNKATTLKDNIHIKKNDKVRFTRIVKYRNNKDSEIIINGYNPTETIKKENIKTITD